MLTLDPPQNPVVIQQKQAPRHQHDRPRNNRRNLGRNTPIPALLPININQRRDQARQAIQTPGQKQLVEQKHAVLPPAPPQPYHAPGADAATHARDDEQRDVLDAVEDLGRRVRRGDSLAGGDVGESGWEDDEPREQDEGEEGGEQVVPPRDRVHGQEHGHVLRVDAVLAVERRRSRRWWGIPSRGASKRRSVVTVV